MFCKCRAQKIVKIKLFLIIFSKKFHIKIGQPYYFNRNVMKDREDEQMFYLINWFCNYQKISSKDEKNLWENYEMSTLKQETKREIMVIVCFDKQG